VTPSSRSRPRRRKGARRAEALRLHHPNKSSALIQVRSDLSERRDTPSGSCAAPRCPVSCPVAAPA
jgi:hypothetical protein